MTLESGYIRSGAAEIYYEETGQGRPVLFAHAGVADRRMWDPQFADPVTGHRFIRSDMRGFGKSEWVAESYSPHSDLLAVIDALRLDEIILVGCSMGGRAVLEIAVSIPGRIAGLIVIGTGTPGWEPPDGWYMPPEYEGSEEIFKAGEWRKAAEIDARVWGVGVGRTWEQTNQEFLQRLIEMDLKPVTTEYERNDHMSWMEPPIAGRLDEIRVPTVVVVGEHDLPDIMAGTEHLAGLLSDQPLVVIPASAHLPSMEHPGVFNPLLESWLGRFSAV